MTSILHPPNETEYSSTRTTREGKELTYTLKVLQQPERARACGAGAKCERNHPSSRPLHMTDYPPASADRRPVDPPPVVELRIFESDKTATHKADITFGYNANFFLYASLDLARPMAQGRVQPQPMICPVLTGVPVAGIAYLDRPSPAGYFIFPDLSVRHEGRYRLNFNLYEEIKDPKDADMESTNPQELQLMPTSPKPSAPKSFMHFRLEVKSQPFTVYSAKKFPGLAESTHLSRVVAEQGCRVRIRRDVRMRRRDTKAGLDHDDYDNEDVFSRGDRFATPESTYSQTPIERPRSISHGSVDASGPYGPQPLRRPSMQDLGYYGTQNYQQPQAGPPSAPSSVSGYSTVPYGSSESHHVPQLPQIPAQQYSQNQPGYSPHVRHASNSHEYSYQQYHQQPLAPPIRSHSFDYKASQDRDRIRPDPFKLPYDSTYDSISREENQPYCPQGPNPAALPHTITPSNSTERNSAILPTILPPLKDIPNLPKGPELDRLLLGPSPLPSPSYDPMPGKGWMYPNQYVPAPKRNHSQVFPYYHQDQPLHNGMRPSTAGEKRPQESGDLEADEDPYNEGNEIDPKLMVYKRADGSDGRKTVPISPSDRLL